MRETAMQQYLQATTIQNFQHASVDAYRQRVLHGVDLQDNTAIAIALYLHVRDDIVYDPYLPFYKPEHYRASHIVELGRAFCIGKAALLCALARACGIPSRLGYANVRNHLATKQFLDFLGSDIFVFHGYTEMYLNEKWVKATPAFDAKLCRRHSVPALEFDALHDSVFQTYNDDNARFMEYLHDYGCFADVPVERIVATMRKTYGEARVQAWIDHYDGGGDFKRRRFSDETVVR